MYSLFLSQLLMYHILPAAHTTSDIPPGKPTSLQTLLPGQNVSVSESSPTGPFFVEVNDRMVGSMYHRQHPVHMSIRPCHSPMQGLGTLTGNPSKITITNVKAGNSYIQVMLR